MKFPKNINFIHVNEISNSKNFEYNLTPKNLELVSAIKKEGILIPVWLCENKGYEIFDGHQRVKAAKLINLVKIPALIHPKQNRDELFISSLYVNKFTREMSVTEKLLAFHTANKFFSVGTAGKVPNILTIPKIIDLQEIAYKVVKLPRWLKYYFHHNDFPMKIIRKLIRYSLIEYRSWFHLASSLNLNGTELTLILDQIRDMMLRDGIKPPQLWTNLGIENIMKMDITNHQKVQKIKIKVEAYRFPTLKNIQRKLRQEVKRIENELSLRLDINWDDKLEQAGIVMNIQLSDEAEVKEFIKKIGKGNFKNELTLLFDLMNRNPEILQ
jgi:hypothetical protein